MAKNIEIKLLFSIFLAFLAGSLSLWGTPAYASLPLSPRLSVTALASNYTVGQADIMLPVQLNSPIRQNLYVDPAVSYGTDQENQLDMGFGYRWIATPAAIFGSYLFGGYSRTDNNARLWVVNPGIEALGSRWDVHLNAYFPMGDRHYTAGTLIKPYFSGHSQLGKVFLIHQYTNSGGDIKAGYQLFPRSSWKAYLGSYYFLPADGEVNSIWGGAAGLEYWFTRDVKVIGNYTYDNLHHSTYALGLGLEWGGTHVHRSNPELDERLTDPVERYLAKLGHGSTIPNRLKAKPMIVGVANNPINPLTEVIIVFANNIAFFSQTGGPNNGGTGLTSANCTFENPCGPTDFSQTSVTTLGGLLPNTQLYFNGGTYTAPSSVTLVSGQSLQSRTANYTQPATDTARSTLTLPTLTLQSNNTLDNMIVSGSVAGPKVIVQGPNNVIRGSQIGLPGNAITTGINNLGGGLLIDNTIIAATNANFGLVSQNGGTMTVQNSQLNITGDVPIGITASNGAIITLSTVDIQLIGSSSTQDTTGIFAQGGGSVTASDTSLSISAPRVIGLDTVSGQIQFSGGNLEIAASTALLTQQGPANSITLNGTVCEINGMSVDC